MKGFGAVGAPGTTPRWSRTTIGGLVSPSRFHAGPDTCARCCSPALDLASCTPLQGRLIVGTVMYPTVIYATAGYAHAGYATGIYAAAIYATVICAPVIYPDVFYGTVIYTL